MRWLKLSVPAIAVLAFLGYRLLPRSVAHRTVEAMMQRAVTAHWTTNDRSIATIQEKLKRQPNSAEWNAALGQAYLQKARESGDPSYYAKAAALFDHALAENSRFVDALVGKASEAMSRHDFQKALELAQQAAAVSPDTAGAFGVLADAHIELGEYDEAIHALDRMIHIKPNLSSYSRVSYVRELMGDIDGAIQAMQMAVDSGSPDAENTAWCMVQSGNLYANSGRPAEADARYRAALDRFPNYVHALAGLARLAASRNNWEDAVHYYQSAIDRTPLPEFLIGFGEAYERMGKAAEANAQFDLVEAIQQIYRSNGVSMDIEMALFNADRGVRVQEAVDAARNEWSRRKSVRVADVYAWALYRAGQYTEARKMMHEALRLGTRDPLFLKHAEAINAARG